MNSAQDFHQRSKRCSVRRVLFKTCQSELATNDSGGLFFVVRQRCSVRRLRPSQALGPLSRRNAVMLVLSRKIGEKLVIGDNITVVVSRVAGNRVTLGIEAPNDVRIVRGELHAEEAETAPAVHSARGFHREPELLSTSAVLAK